MGLFDFLHGKDEESEAEAYMKQRNRAYAKRAAQYKQQESLDNSDDWMTETTEKYTRPDGTKVTRTSKTISKGYVNGTPSGKVGDLLNQLTGGMMDEIKSIEQDCRNKNMTDEERQAELKERLRSKYGNSVRVDSSSKRSTIKTSSYQSNCSTPGVKNKDQSIFVIRTAKKVGQVWKVCGEIIRGRFGFGDTVTVKTATGDKIGRISKIVRQGEEIDYANISSGVIVIDIHVNGFEIKPGDKLTKDSIG